MIKFAQPKLKPVNWNFLNCNSQTETSQGLWLSHICTYIGNMEMNSGTSELSWAPFPQNRKKSVALSLRRVLRHLWCISGKCTLRTTTVQSCSSSARGKAPWSVPEGKMLGSSMPGIQWEYSVGATHIIVQLFFKRIQAIQAEYSWLLGVFRPSILEYLTEYSGATFLEALLR